MFMRSRILIILIGICVICILFTSGCLPKMKGSISGTIYRSGKPASGNLRILNPQDFSVVAECLVMDGGKFMLKNIPPGEWLIGLTGRTGGVIGKYHYIKVTGAGFKSDFVFDIMEEDSKALDLISRVSGGKPE